MATRSEQEEYLYRRVIDISEFMDADANKEEKLSRKVSATLAEPNRDKITPSEA